MQKSSVFIVAMGALIAGGMALSVWANDVLFEGFEAASGPVGDGQQVSVTVTLEQGSRGVYAVEAPGLEGMLEASVTGPGGGQAAGGRVDTEADEQGFDAAMQGNYTLVISGDPHDRVTGYIGPEPGAFEQAITFASIYVLVVGLGGMAVGMIYAAVRRRR